MLFSQDRRFVFIAVPKTGTTSIQSHLLGIDPKLMRNRVLDARGEWLKMPTHATVREIKQVMGPRAADYRFVAFFRDPRELVLSKYYFYRNGRPAQAVDQNGVTLRQRPDGGSVSMLLALRVLSARTLPLPLWAALYPFSSGARFVVNGRGRVDVDELGDYADLANETRRIFRQFGYSDDALRLPHRNATDYEKTGTLDGWLKRVVLLKLAADLAIYKAIHSDNFAVEEPIAKFQ